MVRGTGIFTASGKGTFYRPAGGAKNPFQKIMQAVIGFLRAENRYPQYPHSGLPHFVEKKDQGSRAFLKNTPKPSTGLSTGAVDKGRFLTAQRSADDTSYYYNINRVKSNYYERT